MKTLSLSPARRGVRPQSKAWASPFLKKPTVEKTTPVKVVFVQRKHHHISDLVLHAQKNQTRCRPA